MKYCNFCQEENVQYMIFYAIIIIIIIILSKQLEFFICLPRWTTGGKHDITMYLHNSICRASALCKALQQESMSYTQDKPLQCWLFSAKPSIQVNRTLYHLLYAIITALQCHIQFSFNCLFYKTTESFLYHFIMWTFNKALLIIY